MSVERDLTEHEVRWLLTMPTWGLHEGQEIERKFRALAAELVRIETSERLIALAANERLAKLEETEKLARVRGDQMMRLHGELELVKRECEERIPKLQVQKMILALVMTQQAGNPVGTESHER